MEDLASTSTLPHWYIIHCVAQVDTITNLLYHRFMSLLSCTFSSSSDLIRSSICGESSISVQSYTGYNNVYGYRRVRYYNDTDYDIASSIRSSHGFHSRVLNHGCFVEEDEEEYDDR